MTKGKATLGQMAAACRQHDEVTGEDMTAVLRGVLNRIAFEKVTQVLLLHLVSDKVASD